MIDIPLGDFDPYRAAAEAPLEERAWFACNACGSEFRGLPPDPAKIVRVEGWAYFKRRCPYCADVQTCVWLEFDDDDDDDYYD